MKVKLTPAQTALMGTFDSLPDLKPETRWVCKPEELRVVKACAAKGLLTIKRAPARGEHFEICLTGLGISVSQDLLERQVREAVAT
ncbi:MULTISPECIES: hypothetical protein [Burkholderia]|uniref:Uncharacterized protein n=2 Tax=Burkholderia cepacia complex TaxID=87882 RepID=A0AAP1YB28_9BURK|nr:MULTISPECIES: hypothetical protein [Burkholderia]MBK1902219.1 hypothetical protein [Burkholderia contaminans]MBK1910502.1 hypothetical protein [Burkholderia contaminans]MBK1923961.1 hypothetical protein [Burkholderia contaminans]MBK1932173.1 hypothetical protein [Burkholderia contaminans]MBK1939422.1 hypothetical protein [Burkholderia contaminans]